MLKKLSLIVLVVIGLLALAIQMQPEDYRIERSINIRAKSAVLFQQVNDFHQWEAWSPWAKLDPTMKSTYEGTASGVGAIYTWAGNSEVGEGRMTLLESDPKSRISIQLDFIKPVASTCTTEFTFNEADNQTLVTWSMTGKNDFSGKAFDLLMSLDKMVGSDFEKGLFQLKLLNEPLAPTK